MNCKTCELEIDEQTDESNGGYCDDCILETMDPAWVREHYPDASGGDEDEDDEAEA